MSNYLDLHRLEASLDGLKEGIKERTKYPSYPKPTDSVILNRSIDIFKIHYNKFHLKIDVSIEEVMNRDFDRLVQKEEKEKALNSALIIVKKFIDTHFKDRSEEIKIDNNQIQVVWKEIETLPPSEGMKYTTAIINYEKLHEKKPSPDLELFLFLDDKPTIYSSDDFKNQLKGLSKSIFPAPETAQTQLEEHAKGRLNISDPELLVQYDDIKTSILE